MIELRSNRVDADAVMSHLFATTELESSYRVNMNMIGADGRPQVKSIREILLEWLDIRQSTVKRRLNYQLDKIDRRLHILAGLLIAYLDIDTVIKIIREEDKPKPVLIAHFGIDDIQAEAILELKLRHLARLEEMEIRTEQDELAAQAAKLRDQLNNPESLKSLIIDELQADAKLHGDDRRSPIMQRAEATALKESDLMPAEAITVVLSQAGWIRAAKGDIDAINLNYRAGDQYLTHCAGKSNQRVFVLDNSGRSYALPASTLPSARSLGEPLTTKLNPPTGSRFVDLIMGDEQQAIVLASSQGYGFVSSVGNLDTTAKAGKALVNLSEGSELLPLIVIPPQADQLAVLSSSGRLLIFALADLPIMSKGKGNKLMALEKTEHIQAMVAFNAQSVLAIDAGARTLSIKGNDLSHYTSKRGLRGHLLPRGYQKVSSMRTIWPTDA